MDTKEIENKLVELQPQLRKYANRLTANKERAEDLLQETNLRTLENQEKFAQNVNFKSWVFTIMFHIFVNEWKRWVRTIFIPDFGQVRENQLKNVAESYNSDYCCPTDYFDLYEAADKCISDMSPVNRKIWKMHDEGYHYNEIAEQTHLILGTVKSRLHCIRKELQKNCKE